MPQMLCLGMQDRQTGFKIGQLDVGGEAPLEAGDEAGLELRNLAGAAVAGEDDLFAGLEEVVERVEEFFLDALLAGEELDVVEQEDVGVAITLAELDEVLLLQRLDELVGEFFGGEVGNSLGSFNGKCQTSC